jgi:tungstate transport system ATP-binding protein
MTSHVSSLLRFRDLCKITATGQPLLAIDEFDIPAGACILLNGRNGAGKTSLLKILAGLDAPERATVEYDGATLDWQEARRRYRRDVIYLHQQPYLFDCSVADNVAYGLRAAGLSRADSARRVEQALVAAQLAHLAARNALELSGGERQRVALTRALVLAPRLLLLDEPLANLDGDSRDHTCTVLRELKTRRIAVVLTSHERLSLTQLTDYHYELADGRITAIPTIALEPVDGIRRTVVRFEEASARRQASAPTRETIDERR